VDVLGDRLAQRQDQRHPASSPVEVTQPPSRPAAEYGSPT
jgi:hypothetical protein